jgi:hypothetical protein
MNGRGGRGRNQGRKKIIPDIFDLMLRVGQRCEDIQKTERDKKALANYEDQHDVRVLRDAQQLVMERAVGSTPEEVERFVESETHLKKTPRRTIDLKKFRPKRKTREEICQLVAAEIGGISWYTVDKYWKEYRRNIRKSHWGAGTV